FWRELALPYCLIAAILAWWHGRRREALVWAAGLALFGAFFVWHGVAIAQRLDAGATTTTDVSYWLQFTGMPFHITAMWTNWWLAGRPGWLLASYLCVSVLGLASWPGERGLLVTLTVAAYLLAFMVVGRPYNVYWGLLYAPLLPFGLVRAPTVIRD